MGLGLELGRRINFQAVAVMRTVVLLKALEARGVLDSMNGRIAVGWLVVEDLATVLVLVLLLLAGVLGGTVVEVAHPQALWVTIGQTLLKSRLHRHYADSRTPRDTLVALASVTHRLA